MVPRIHERPRDRAVRQPERVAKFMRGHREKASPFFVAIVLQHPYFFLVEMNVPAAIFTWKESVRQDLASAIKRISIAVITAMKVYQNVRSVAVNLLEDEFRVPRPKIEGFAQLVTNTARVEAARVLGSQAYSVGNPCVVP